MKDLIKKVLPRPVIDAALSARNTVRLAGVPVQRFDCRNLPPYGSLNLDTVFGNSEIAATWQKDSAAIEALLPDKNRFDGVNPGDRKALYYLIRAFKPKRVLEVGTHIGASTIHIAAALKTNGEGHIISVDINDVNAPDGPWKKTGLPENPAGLAEKLGCGDLIDFIACDSLTFMKEAADKFDFIFLDGDHASQTVYREVAAALELLAPGGLILLHDYYPAGKPLFPQDTVITGPFMAIARIIRENQALNVHPLSPLPWETKQGSHNTSLALLASIPQA